MVKIERVGDKIWVEIPWHGDRGKAAAKAVMGGRWNPTKKVWVYPLDWQTCLDIRKYIIDPLCEEMELGPEMEKWAKAEKKRQGAIPEVSQMSVAELPRLKKNNPKLWEAVQSRPFQTVGIAFAAARRTLLLADDPGLGKTIQTIGSFEEAGVCGPILVIAPKTALHVTWPAEICRWTERDEYIIIGSDLKPAERAASLESVFEDCEADPTLRVWVMMTSHYVRMSCETDQYGNYVYDEKGIKNANYELPEVFAKPWAGVVIDESHRFIAGSTGNKKKWSQQKLGLGAIPVREDGMRIALSGTPMRGKPENLWGTLNWLRPKIYTGYWKWINRHFDVYEDPMGGSKTMGEMKSTKEFYDESSFVMMRREKGEVAKDLPPKSYGGEPLDPSDPASPIGVWLDMSPKQAKAYRSMAEQATVKLEGGTLLANGVLAEMTRLKQFASSHGAIIGEEQRFLPTMPSNKFEWILNFLDEHGISAKDPIGDNKVIIASQFTQLINTFADELNDMGLKTFVLTGETPDKRRAEIQEIFQTERGPDCTRIFLLNTIAGGTSITLDAADDVIIVDETFIPDDQLQVEDRAHRLSRIDHNVTIWYLRSRGTIEETIGRTTTEREAVCREIIDGSRGVNIAKKILGD